jgi:60 kDa SS-A/Ro ribonucleoprotein
MLTALELNAADWAAIARNGSWQMVRMNLNTFARQGVFAVDGLPQLLADRLRNAEAIAQARAFPYQLLAAYKSATADVPLAVRNALQDAMEIALSNVPTLAGKVVVCPDVSGSMASPVTGRRAGGTTAIRCIDVAALYAAAVLRKNADATVLPFEADVVSVQLNARDTVLTNAERLAAIGGGGTNCSAPLARLNAQKAKADLVIFISDNESWVDSSRRGATATLREWELFRVRNPNAKLACVDLQPYASTQASEREDILNIGGFSDEVFKIINAFATRQLSAAHWVGAIEAIAL